MQVFIVAGHGVKPLHGTVYVDLAPVSWPLVQIGLVKAVRIWANCEVKIQEKATSETWKV